MFILADTVFDVFCLSPHFVKKMQLVGFCAWILQNNHKSSNIVLSANIYVMLLSVFSEQQHAYEKIQNEPTVITCLCQTLLSENTDCMFKRRMNLSILWNICKSDHYADTSSCTVIFEYCLLIFQSIDNKQEYDMDTQLLCQKILHNMTRKKLYSTIRNSENDHEIIRALQITRQNIKKNKAVFDTCYHRYLSENTELLCQLRKAS